MQTYKNLFYSLAAGIIILAGCGQAKIVGPEESNGTPPGTVSNITVKNLPGGAKINYALPKDADLFYVEADYEIRPGVKEQTKSSYYNNSLIVQGFGDTGEHKVKLYAVDRSGNKSQPVVANIKPLTSAVQEAYKTLSYKEDFGGIHATFQNKNLAKLVLNVLIVDSTGDWEDYDKYYSSIADNTFSVRGLPAVPTTFGLFIQDKWGNRSDTLVQKLSPIFEVELAKSKFKDMSAYLPGTPAVYSSSHSMPYMWDDNINDFYHTTQNRSEGAGFPLHFAFDLGVKARLSRMKLWPRQGEWIYTHGNVKDAIIYGTNQDPSTWSPFNLNDWIKLGEYHCYKPSGLPVGQVTQADQVQSEEGQDIEFPISDPSVRYIMFVVIDSWAQPSGDPGGFSHIAEITIWGQPQP